MTLIVRRAGWGEKGNVGGGGGDVVLLSTSFESNLLLVLYDWPSSFTALTNSPLLLAAAVPSFFRSFHFSSSSSSTSSFPSYTNRVFFLTAILQLTVSVGYSTS